MEKKSGNFGEHGFGITYVDSSVALEGTVINPEFATGNADSSTLEVACPPPGHGNFFRKVLETRSIHSPLHNHRSCQGSLNHCCIFGQLRSHHSSTNNKVPCPRRDLERNFEIVLFAEAAQMGIKSSSNES
jgi:hypothetical protein